MSNAVDRERAQRDDHCPLCGEGIDWSAGDHLLGRGGRVWCQNERQAFPVAVLEDRRASDDRA